MPIPSRKFLPVALVVAIAAGAAWFFADWNLPSEEGNGPAPTERDVVDLIRVTRPRPNDTVGSPIVIEGQARGYWYFEASFPIVLLDSNGIEIGIAVAQAHGEWMTENFVPFRAVLAFDEPTERAPGTLVLKKDNPSGLPEHDAELLIPVILERKLYQ